MPQRIPVESRMFAAFVAAAATLVLVAWLVVSAGGALMLADARVDASLREDHVQSMLSSTIAVASPGDERAGLTKSVHQLLAEVASMRADAHRRLDAVKAWSAVFAALTLMLAAVAGFLLHSLLRERREFEARLAAEVNHDRLTGLPNRRFFSEWLSFAIANARRDRAHVGVLFIDIGGCAAVAELHGGPAAEALLVEIARRFRAAAREGDVFARLGASEFALATPNAHDVRALSMLAQRLRDALNDPAQAPLADTPIGTSIGVAFFPEDADDSAGVMAAANAAMFAARRAGRNHVAFNAIAA
jgi:diguanylate cyclase (GGDEF)-like protein